MDLTKIDFFYPVIVKKILDSSITAYGLIKNKTNFQVMEEIAKHIKDTRCEYFEAEPNLNFNNPLCRLGYFYKHVIANATLIEIVIKRLPALFSIFTNESINKINICSIGSGPGTEIFGITKALLDYFLFSNGKKICGNITFTLVDAVSEWKKLCSILEREIHIFLDSPENYIDSVIYPPDIFDKIKSEEEQKIPIKIESRYFQENINNQENNKQISPILYSSQNLMIFNYFISENKVLLKNLEVTLSDMIKYVAPNCYFIIIDRLENKTTFHKDVFNAVSNSSLVILKQGKIGGVIDAKTEIFTLSRYEEYFNSDIRKTFQSEKDGSDKVFYIIAQKV